MGVAPRACRRSAYAAFAESLQSIESLEGLGRAAVALSMHVEARHEPSVVLRRLDDLATRVRERLRSRDPEAVLAHVHAVLFEEGHFRGNRSEYFDERNSYLGSVLERRVGIPISLALVYVWVVRRLEVDACGVNAPGHFLVRILLGTREYFVDAFHEGRMHTRDEALAFLAQVHGKALDPATALPLATHRQWIYRMLQNLKGIFRDAQRLQDHAAMLELEALLNTVPQA